MKWRAVCTALGRTMIPLVGLVLLLTVFSAQAFGSNYIYYSENSPNKDVKRINDDGATGSMTIDGSFLNSAQGVAVDPAHGYVYYSDTSAAKIYRTDLNGGNKTTFLSSVYANSIAVNPNGYIYFSEGNPNYDVKRVNRDGNGLTTIYYVAGTSSSPKCVAVDSTNGCLYYSDTYPSVKTIFRANLDGSGAMAFLPGVCANSIAVDPSGYIYFSESTNPNYDVKRVNRDSPGSPTTIYTSGSGTPQGVAVDHANGFMYYSDPYSAVKTIFRANLDGITGATPFLTNTYANAIAICPAPPSPPTVTAAATNTTGNTVTVIFSKTMATPPAAPAGFTVSAGGSVTAVALNSDHTKYDLTLASSVAYGQTVTLSYAAGSGVQSSDGGVLVAFSGQTVTNNVPQPTIGSFSDVNTSCSYFDANHTTVYIKGAGFAANTPCHIAYYDGSDKIVTSDGTTSGADGSLSDALLLTGRTSAVTGAWHVAAYQDAVASPPDTYSDTGPHMLTSVGFTVEDNAIPEFPAGISLLVVAVICGLIYRWRRGKRLATA